MMSSIQKTLGYGPPCGEGSPWLLPNGIVKDVYLLFSESFYSRTRIVRGPQNKQNQGVFCSQHLSLMRFGSFVLMIPFGDFAHLASVKGMGMAGESS